MTKKNGPDVIEKILAACYEHNKDALFVMSLMHQYEDRGFLTRGQMVGLHKKALKVPNLPPGLLATLEATINKLPLKDKTPLSDTVKKEDSQLITIDNQINEILLKYPSHKAVLNYQLKRKTNVELSAIEKTELNKLHKLLIKKPA